MYFYYKTFEPTNNNLRFWGHVSIMSGIYIYQIIHFVLVDANDSEVVVCIC